MGYFYKHSAGTRVKSNTGSVSSSGAQNNLASSSRLHLTKTSNSSSTKNLVQLVHVAKESLDHKR